MRLLIAAVLCFVLWAPSESRAATFAIEFDSSTCFCGASGRLEFASSAVDANGDGSLSGVPLNYLFSVPGGTIPPNYDDGIIAVDIEFASFLPVSWYIFADTGEPPPLSTKLFLQIEMRGTIMDNLIQAYADSYGTTGASLTQSPWRVSPVPVPAALPLLASGLCALGFIGWRRKRRAAAAA